MGTNHNMETTASIIKAAEDALNETNAILQKMYEMAVQVANDVGTDADRYEILSEMASQAMLVNV
ncbi:MAG: hypothetical protein LBI42_06655 [Chitinispirillales bacterium]|jgi:flagellin|nr:hypothetical protein [Chitinispirillales bacterium]